MSFNVAGIRIQRAGASIRSGIPTMRHIWRVHQRRLEIGLQPVQPTYPVRHSIGNNHLQLHKHVHCIVEEVAGELW